MKKYDYLGVKKCENSLVVQFRSSISDFGFKKIIIEVRMSSESWFGKLCFSSDCSGYF